MYKFGIMGVVLIGALVLASTALPQQSADTEGVARVAAVAGGISPVTIALHKSPTCGCCTAYGSYLKNEDYAVDVNNVADMDAVKEELGVPMELMSCHTMEVGGYVVEGHVPIAAINKLLVEKPAIKGIGMPGMPMGAPGMPGSKTDDLVIYEISMDGEAGAVFITL